MDCHFLLFVYDSPYLWDSLVVQRVKSLPAMQETRVQTLGQEDSLEKEIECEPSGEPVPSPTVWPLGSVFPVPAVPERAWTTSL